MKKEIKEFDYAGDILKLLKTGALLTTKAGEKINSMTIGWGTLGIVWGLLNESFPCNAKHDLAYERSTK